MKTREQLIGTYSEVAEAYAARFSTELDRKPLDRRLLARLVESVPRGRPICDLGCGPGQVAEQLRNSSPQEGA